MPRDKYHPYMVPFSLAKRMAETGHTPDSVRDFLQPYDVSVLTVRRWMNGSKVPYQLKEALIRGLNSISPPTPRWMSYSLGPERTLRGLSRRQLGSFLGVATGTIENWEERGEVPGNRLLEIQKLFSGILPKPRKRN